MTSQTPNLSQIADGILNAFKGNKHENWKGIIVEALRQTREEALEEARLALTGCDQFHCGHQDCNKFRALTSGSGERK